MNTKEISKVYLLNVPLEDDYKNTLYFADSTAQHSYFESKIVKSALNVSYIRKNDIIRFPDTFDNLQNVNYVMYQNTFYSNKWFYAFIKDVTYIDDGRCDIEIETDYIQTWMFDITIKPSFVEREHVNNDTAGMHTQPENLETGDYILNGSPSIPSNFQLWAYVINVTTTPDNEQLNPTEIGGILSAGDFYVFYQNEQLKLIEFLTSYQDVPDAIVQVYTIPRALVETNVVDLINGYHRLSTSASVVTLYHTVNKPVSVGGYAPRNKKLLTFPYTYLMFSNNNGSTNILQYEKFTSAECIFEIDGLPTVGGSIKCIPNAYLSNIHDEGLMCGKYPICSWSKDLYTAWVNANSMNVVVGGLASVGSVIGGTALLLTGGGSMIGAGMIAGGVTGIGNILGQVYEHSFIPSSASGNTNGGDILTTTGYNTFIFTPMSIKQEFAKVIDGYFDMFGYKVNSLKVPNKNHRQRWWYTKTVDINIDGNIPNKDMQIIKNCYNNGITFWRNPTEIQNYGLSNPII